MLTRTERLDLAPTINQAGEVEREARLARAKAWLCKRWSQEHPNEQHIIQLADYAEALFPQTLPAPGEVERLRAALLALLPGNINAGNPAWGDETIVPVDMTLGEIRQGLAALATPPAALQEITWRGTDEEQYEARINACCSRRTQWPAQDCPRDGSCDDCWQDMAEALKVTEPKAPTLPDGFVHPDEFAREYQASVKAKAVCDYCNGTGRQLSGFAQTPSSRPCLVCKQ